MKADCLARGALGVVMFALLVVAVYAAVTLARIVERRAAPEPAFQHTFPVQNWTPIMTATITNALGLGHSVLVTTDSAGNIVMVHTVKSSSALLLR